MSNLKIVLGFAGGMGTDEESMSFVVFVGYTALVNALEGSCGIGTFTIAYLAAIELKAWATPERY